MEPQPIPTATKPTTPAWLIALAWVVVAIPLAWGVVTSVKKSLPLFQATTTRQP